MKNHLNRFGIDDYILDFLSPDSVILDYGCGAGEISREFLSLGYKVVGMDINVTCEANLRGSLSSAENERFEFITVENDTKLFQNESQKFDCIICREVLEHVNDPVDIFHFFYSCLSDKGIIVISIPTSWSERYFSFIDPQWLNKSDHRRIFKNKDIRKLISQNGFFQLKEKGQSFRWTFFWFLLTPFKVNHFMGNPLNHPTLSKIALRISKVFCSIPLVEKIGNNLLPKSRFHYIAKRKPRVLVVYDYRDWILGKWAANIRSLFEDDFDIVTISMFHAINDNDYISKLLKKVDIIHLLLPHPFDHFKKLAGDRAIISTIHHWIEGGENYSNAIANSVRLVTGAGVWRDALVRRGVDYNLITVVHSGVEDRFFIDQPPLITKSEKFTLGFFAKRDSNEADRKGTRHLLKLADMMREMSVTENFHLIISGPGWEENVQSLNTFGLKTTYIPFVEENNMPALYQSLDVYLMLSDVEGGPVTIAEAMASGCLVFTTNIGIAREIIADNHTGIIINSSDSMSIIEKLLYFKKNPHLKDEICKRAKSYAKENMRYETTMTPIKGLYRETFNLCNIYGEGKLDPKKENKFTDSKAVGIKP